jgi:dihydrodipicolinate synthase/N-acetylneuraminate lyase
MPTPPRYLVALITPFDRREELDLDAHRHNLETLWEAGVRGFVLAGSNGEGPYLEPGERQLLVEASRKTLGGRAYLMCGVMAETLREARRQVDEAQAGGADAVLVLTPTTLARQRLDLIEAFYRELADRSPLPVVLYSVPATTAYQLAEDSAARLLDHPNVIGMKDSSGDPVRIQRVAARSERPVWSGSSQALTLSIAAGAYGAITGSGNYVPRLVLDTLAAAQRNPLRARDLQARLSEAAQKVESLGIAGVKAASVAAGLRPGRPRRPLRTLPRSAARRLTDFLTA